MAGRPDVDAGTSGRLGRQLFSALALVVGVALAFWLIGKVRGGDGVAVEDPSPTPTVTSTQPTEVPTDPVTSAPPTEVSPAPSDGVSPTSGTGIPAPTESMVPAEISIQLLDGVRSDGGARMTALGDRLEAGGYNVVAENPAVRDYEVTTIFYSEGHENDARQVAAFIPEIGVLEPKPDNLTAEVDVHIVVGANYPEP